MTSYFTLLVTPCFTSVTVVTHHWMLLSKQRKEDYKFAIVRCNVILSRAEDKLPTSDWQLTPAVIVFLSQVQSGFWSRQLIRAALDTVYCLPTHPVTESKGHGSITSGVVWTIFLLIGTFFWRGLGFLMQYFFMRSIKIQQDLVGKARRGWEGWIIAITPYN